LPNITYLSLTVALYNYQFKNLQDTPKQSHTLKFDIVPNLKDTISLRLKKWESDTRSWTGIFSYNNFPLTFYDYDFTHYDALVGWTRVITDPRKRIHLLRLRLQGRVHATAGPGPCFG